ncbi:hypothetical protein [Pseudobutyrivibrio sp.]|nr:hypothetical protein [Pseudobutyrivibrio sp.]MBP3261075.1 hypothetical protein [Pseudobutyrivibrio sp.]
MTRYDKETFLGILELIKTWETEGLPPNKIIEYIDIIEGQIKKPTQKS